MQQRDASRVEAGSNQGSAARAKSNELLGAHSGSTPWGSSSANEREGNGMRESKDIVECFSPSILVPLRSRSLGSLSWTSCASSAATNGWVARKDTADLRTTCL